jgi:hypothetical protein
MDAPPVLRSPNRSRLPHKIQPAQQLCEADIRTRPIEQLIFADSVHNSDHAQLSFRVVLSYSRWTNRPRSGHSTLKKTAGALHADGRGAMLSFGREVKTEIPVESF